MTETIVLDNGTLLDFLETGYDLVRMDKVEITTPCFLANVYGAEPTIDMHRSGVLEVINQKYSRSHRYAVSGAVQYWAKIRRGFQTARHVWRDSNTSDWFCDDAFRTAAEQISPGKYRFTEMAED